MKIYSLLVGVNEYKNQRINKLRGCQADAELFKKTLQEKFSHPVDNFKTLYNADATRDNIVHAFNTHLIDNLRNDPAEDNVAVFYFSGHGSQSSSPQAFWHIEPDHLDETLVCHDSRHDGIPDLRDKELRMLIHKLSQHCQHILIVLDCCHGGHGTRVLEDNLESVRMAAADETPRLLESYLYHDEMKSALQSGKKLPEGKHILLAGCQDFQLSRERPQGEANQPHGLFTYALCETLNALPYPVSYRDLLTRVHTKVQQQQLSQSPQLEAIAGANDRESVLGGNIQPLHLLAYREDNSWVVNVGAIHGFSIGDQVALFEGQILDIGNLDTEEAPTGHISQLGTFKSTLELGNSALLNNDLQYNGLVTRRNFKKIGVILQGNDHDLAPVRQLLAQDIGADGAGHFLTVDSEQPLYELHADGQYYYATSVNDPRPLFKKQITAKFALEQLANMARWWQKLELENLQTAIPEDAVEIVINHNGQTSTSEDVSLAYTLEVDATGEESWIQPSFTAELRLKAGYPKSLYCSLLYFDGCTGGIQGSVLIGTTLLTHKQGSLGGQVNAVGSVPIYEGEAIPVKIKDELYEQGVTRIQDYIKVIVSETDFDTSLMEQSGNELYAGSKGTTRGSLETAFEQLMGDVSHNRSLALSSAPKKATDWSARTITLSVHRPQVTQEVRLDRDIKLNGDEQLNVQIAAHPTFRGSVRLISTQNENEISRGLEQGDDSQKAESRNIDSSPAVFADPESIVDFSNGYQSDLGLDALEIFVDSGARGDTDQAKQVSSKDPLKIVMSGELGEGEHIIPYTHDGDYYLPVGYSSVMENGRIVVSIEELPESALKQPDGDTRSLGSALKIYFRKLIYRDLLGLDTAIHKLGIPQFDEQDPTHVIDYQTDKSIIAAQVKQANNILLVTHGIIGESRTMVGFVNHSGADGKRLVDDYDLIIGFDYENLNTSIEDVARALKQELADVGITTGADKQLDIVAHSMGGLVSRWLIEHEGGAAIIRKLVMVGTPNGGSPYANVKDYGYGMMKTWAYSNLVIALNSLAPAYASNIVIGGLLKLLNSIDNTLDQMSPDSEFIQEIHRSELPSVPYALIAGSTDTLEMSQSNSAYQIAKLLHHLKQKARLKALDLLTEKLFKETNDMAASMSSMTQFNPKWRDNVAMDQVDCDHISYFSDEATIKKITQHLGALSKKDSDNG